ncbi:diguanylate cyclase, partial [Vibrio coralliirubri]
IIFLLNSDIQDAFKFAERLRKKVELYEFANVGGVTVSIGVAFWGGEEQSIRVTLKEADTALYRAKNNGRNRSELLSSD